MSNNMQSVTGAKPANQSALIEEVFDSLGAQVSNAAGLARIAGKAAGMIGASAVVLAMQETANKIMLKCEQ